MASAQEVGSPEDAAIHPPNDARFPEEQSVMSSTLDSVEPKLSSSNNASSPWMFEEKTLTPNSSKPDITEEKPLVPHPPDIQKDGVHFDNKLQSRSSRLLAKILRPANEEEERESAIQRKRAQSIGVTTNDSSGELSKYFAGMALTLPNVQSDTTMDKNKKSKISKRSAALRLSTLLLNRYDECMPSVSNMAPAATENENRGSGLWARRGSRGTYTHRPSISSSQPTEEQGVGTPSSARHMSNASDVFGMLPLAQSAAVPSLSQEQDIAKERSTDRRSSLLRQIIERRRRYVFICAGICACLLVAGLVLCSFYFTTHTSSIGAGHVIGIILIVIGVIGLLSAGYWHGFFYTDAKKKCLRREEMFTIFQAIENENRDAQIITNANLPNRFTTRSTIAPE